MRKFHFNIGKVSTLTDRKDYHRQYYLKRKQLKLINNPSHNNLQKNVENRLKAISKKPFVSGVISYYSTLAALLVFILFNSAFLVNEQLRFYLLKGYSQSYGIFVSLLCEVAVVMLSFFSARIEGKRRLKILTVLFLTVACVLGTIVLGIMRDDAKARQTEEISELLKKELSIVEKQVEDNPKLFPKLLKKEAELRNFLTANEVVNVTYETILLSMIRALAIAWNVIVSWFLGKAILKPHFP